METGPPRAPGPLCQPPNYETTGSICSSGSQLSLVPLMILLVLPSSPSLSFLCVSPPLPSPCFHLSSPPFFVPLSRSEKALSDISCAGCRLGPHLVRGFLELLSVTSCRNMKTCTYCVHAVTLQYVGRFGKSMVTLLHWTSCCLNHPRKTCGKNVENEQRRRFISTTSRLSKNRASMCTFTFITNEIKDTDNK